MAKEALSLPIFIVFLLLLSFTSGGAIRFAYGQKTFCVAKPTASYAELQANMDFACGNLTPGACNITELGGPCFVPNIKIHHASVCMNLYYQSMGRKYWNCDFKNSALISITDPSYGDCHYA